jgi:hypothetical protein
MDWMSIISAHVLWKKRLQSLLDGTSEETLNPDNIGLDNKCGLGQWIYSDGQAYKDMEKFEEVRLMHAEFHKMAADVVRLYQSGDQNGAASLLQGSYSRHSEKLKHRILGLANQVKTPGS